MKSIDIRTTQHVAITHELASLGDRFIALLLDILIFIVAYAAFVWAYFSWVPGAAAVGLNIWLVYLPLALSFLYFFFSESFLHGQSAGKLITRIQVVRADGADLQPGDLALRALLHLIDSLGTLGTLGALLISTSPRGQRMGDMAAGTVVIRLRPERPVMLEDILGITSKEDYKPSFEAVRKLSEADMIVIKSALNRYQLHPSAAHQQILLELSQKMAQLLQVEPPQGMPPITFLKTLLHDYIILTR